MLLNVSTKVFVSEQKVNNTYLENEKKKKKSIGNDGSIVFEEENH